MDYKQLLFSFKGRINRRTFLFCWFMMLLWSYFVQQLIDPTVTVDVKTSGPVIFTLLNFFFGIWVMLALQAKRLHDSHRSSRWLFLHIIPLIGQAILFVVCALVEGSKSTNSYGEKPLAKLNLGTGS
ncbi:DUF805 domain-containing protein [Vibrio sp. FNV 38]|nr:DUF805 domain-containing protein [Vibrio sp. FNV 38]